MCAPLLGAEVDEGADPEAADPEAPEAEVEAGLEAEEDIIEPEEEPDEERVAEAEAPDAAGEGEETGHVRTFARGRSGGSCAFARRARTVAAGNSADVNGRFILAAKAKGISSEAGEG